MKTASIIALRSAASISATDTGPAVNVAEFQGNGYVVLNSGAMAGTTPTSDVKLQHSDDGATNWVDTAVVFTRVTNAASIQAHYVSLDQFKKFVRVVNTIGGATPSVAYSVELIGNKHAD